MCGKRLKDWKTIPIPRRTAFTSTPRAVTSWPRTTIRPASIGSSRFTQRRSVDFPDPDAPMRHTTSCSASSRSIPRSTSSLPNDLWMPSRTRATVVAAHASSGELTPLVARDQPVGEARHRHRDRDEEDRRADVRRVVEVPATSICDWRNASTTPSSADERRVLLQADEVVEERRDDAPDGLRDDDVPQRLRPAEAERARSRLLARVHGLDAGPVHLGDVRRVDEHERRRCPRRAATTGTPGSASAGTPKPRM